MQQTLLPTSKLDKKIKEELLNLIEKEMISLFEKVVKSNQNDK